MKPNRSLRLLLFVVLCLLCIPLLLFAPAVIFIGIAIILRGPGRRKFTAFFFPPADDPGPQPPEQRRSDPEPAYRETTRAAEFVPRDTAHFDPGKSYATGFQEAYSKAREQGQELDPWDLPPEKAPWER